MELAIEDIEDCNIYLPMLLQLAFLGFDDRNPIVYSHANQLLRNLMFRLVAENTDGNL